MANTLEIIIKANDQASKTLAGVLGKAENSLKTVGTGMIKTGALMSAASAPFVAAMASTVQSAARFDESMTNVGAVLGKTKSEMAGINAEVLATGAASRAGPQAAADAYYDIVGGVADASTHMAILNAAIATSEAGSADLGATTSALIAVMNSYGYSANEAAFASDVLTQTVGMGVGSMEEFAAAMPQVTGLANALGIEFDTVGASMAFMTTKGFSASQSATQLRASMVALMNPNEQMKTALQEIGFASGEAAIEQLGLAGTYQLLTAESGTFGANMAGTVGSVEALQAVLAMTDEEFAKFVEDFQAGAEGATDAARAIQLDSLAAQTDLLKSSMEGLKITIGMALIPVITRLVKAAQPVVQSIIKWAQENPKLVSTVGMVAAGVGGLGIALTALGTIVTAAGAGLGLLLGPLGLIIAAIAAFGVAYKTNFLGFGDFIRGLVDDIGRLAEQLKTAFDAEGLAGVGKLLLDKIKNGLGDLASWVINSVVLPIAAALLNADWSAIAGTGLNVLQQIANGLGDLGYWLRINLVYPLIEKLLFADWAGMAAGAVKILAGIAQGLINIGTWVVEKIVTPIINAAINADWANIIQVGANILLKLAEAWLDLAVWVMDNLLMPLGDNIIAGAGVVYDKAKELGAQILQGLLDALASLPGEILKLIEGAIPTSINLPSINLNPFGGGGGESSPPTVTGTSPTGTFSPRAIGGAVSARMPYIVGERGPELFVPDAAGSIVPNNALTGGGGSLAGGTVYDLSGAQILLPNVTNARQFFDDLEREAKRRNKRLAGQRIGVGT